MSTKNTRNGPNTFESSLGGLTVSGKAHSLSAWFVLALRLVIGFAFLYSGAQKVLGGFAAGGYLNHGVAAIQANIPSSGLPLAAATSFR